MNNRNKIKMAESSSILLVWMFLQVLLVFSIGARGGRTLPLRTIKSRTGDVFDCVDIYKQPAFDNPLLKDHKILMKPEFTINHFPHMEDIAASEANVTIVNTELEGGGCPEGTVPIPRVPNNNTTQYSIPHYLPDDLKRNDQNRRQMWAVRRAHRRYWYGASALINVYGVSPIGPDEESSAMIWLRNEDVPSPSQVAVIRAGWSVNPSLYNWDYMPKVTVGWSKDGGQTECLNFKCPGYVQVSPKHGPGSGIWPLSEFHGPQHYTYIHMFKDDKNNWWVALGDLTNVIGYFPARLFSNFDHASGAYFGGYVSCPQGKDCPPMGNGHKPQATAIGGASPQDEQGFDDLAAYMRRVQMIGPDHNWGGLGMAKQSPVQTIESCHQVGAYNFDVHAYKFTFGGPVCPSWKSK